MLRFLLLIWLTTPGKILKLLHIVVKLAFIDLLFDLPLLARLKTGAPNENIVQTHINIALLNVL